MKLLKKLLFPALLLIFILPFVIPLFTQGFGYSDGGWMVVRLSSFHETLRGGQFPVRFLERLNHGYGYPVLNFLYPLPFYIGEGIHLLGVNFINTITLLFALSVIGGAIGMYLFVSNIASKQAGVYAGILYTLFPYHLYDVFSRGSLGEAMAFLFLPFILFFSEKVIEPGKRRYFWAVLLGISLASLVTSHNTLTMIFSPLIVGEWIILIWYTKQFKGLLFAGILGICLAAFFWIPAIFELSYTRASLTQVSSYYEYFLTGVNFREMLGLPALVVIIFGLVSLLRLPKIEPTQKTALLTLLLLMSVLAIALSTQFLDLAWHSKLLVQLVQFPWRFIALPTVTLSILGGMLLARQGITGIILMAVLVIVQAATLHIDAAPRDENLYAFNGDTTTVKNEYMPKWVRSDPLVLPENSVEIISGEGQIQNSDKVNIKTQSVVQINKVYFPGTSVLVNGKETTFDYKTNGFLRLSLGPGQYELRREFRETPLRMIANSLTVLGLLVSLGGLVYFSRAINFSQK